MGASLGPLAPLLGLSLGAGLGRGGGLLGSLAGGAGGLLLGNTAAALLTPSLFGIVPGAVNVAGSTSAAFLHGAYGLLTNPFTIAGGAALIIGGLLLSQNAARRRDEKMRDSLATDARSKVYQLISDVRGGRVSPDGARAGTPYYGMAHLITGAPGHQPNPSTTRTPVTPLTPVTTGMGSQQLGVATTEGLSGLRGSRGGLVVWLTS